MNVIVELEKYPTTTVMEMVHWCYCTFGPTNEIKWNLISLRRLVMSKNCYLLFCIAWGHILNDA